MTKLRYSAVKTELLAIGMRIRRKDGEYCVYWLGAEEEQRYYTDDLEDALLSGKDMSRRREPQLEDASPDHIEQPIEEYIHFGPDE